MRIRAVHIGLPVLAALAAPAAAPAASPSAAVNVTQCHTGNDPSHRSAVYHARMRAVPGTARMAMRFTLVARYGDQKPVQVKVPSLSAWRYSDRGVGRFGHYQRVRRLEVGSRYRVVVRYRWYDASGHVIRNAKRTSGECTEDGDLPNLTVTAVRISPGSKGGTAQYTVSVGNSGRGDAASFTVALIVDGALADERSVDGLAAGDTASVTLTGPVCHRLRAVVDRKGLVPETIDDDNALRTRC